MLMGIRNHLPLLTWVYILSLLGIGLFEKLEGWKDIRPVRPQVDRTLSRNLDYSFCLKITGHNSMGPPFQSEDSTNA